ncbi:MULTISPECIES: hypothetical protein [Flavobacterium]|uniref:Uncharacterized protein n=1 Tax=Flavobacterium beibuense TaxID=657326 RepID=A0A444WFJ3_9FLAO|nr:hypothetical protein [Flavobacterium beibuense]RYJ44565.1 hypothetical protein NU09_1175 [Flavobacterium beibuense]
MTITGNIESIEYRNTAGHEKKVVTIIPDHRQRAFVEFRGRKMDDLHGLKENDEIQVSVMLEGKISKNSGIQYNNLVAQSVAPVLR